MFDGLDRLAFRRPGICDLSRKSRTGRNRWLFVQPFVFSVIHELKRPNPVAHGSRVARRLSYGRIRCLDPIGLEFRSMFSHHVIESRQFGSSSPPPALPIRTLTESPGTRPQPPSHHPHKGRRHTARAPISYLRAPRPRTTSCCRRTSALRPVLFPCS